MSFFKKKYRLRSNAYQLEPLDLSRRKVNEIPNQCAPKIQISEDLGNKLVTIDLQNSTSEPDDKVLLKDRELPKEEHDFNSKIGEDSNRTVSSRQQDIVLGEIAESESDFGEILQEPDFLVSNVSGNSKASVSSRKRSGSNKAEKLNPNVNWLAKDKRNSKKDVPEILENDCLEATQFESKNLKLNDFPTLEDPILESYPTPPVDKIDGSWFSNILSVKIYRDSDSKKEKTVVLDDQAQVLVPKTSENDSSARSRRKSPDTNSSGFGSEQGIETSFLEHPGNERSEQNIHLPMPVLRPQVPDARNQLKIEVDDKPEQLSGTSERYPPVLLLKGESQGPESSEIDSSLSIRKYQELPKLKSDGSKDTFLKHVQPSELPAIFQFKPSNCKSVQTTPELKRLDSKEQSIEKQSSSAPCNAIFKSTDINFEKASSSSIRPVPKKQGNPLNSSLSETRLIVSEPSDSDFENVSPRSVRIREKHAKRGQNSSPDPCGEVENLQPENSLSSPEAKTPFKFPGLKDSQHSNSKMERPSTYSVSTRTTPKSYGAPESTVPKTPSLKSGGSVSRKRRLKDPDLLVPETDKADNSVHISKWGENLKDPYVLIEPIEESYRYLREKYSSAQQPYLVNEECQASEALESEKFASKSKTLESLLSPKAVQDEHGSSSNLQFSVDLKDRNGVETTEAGNISSESIGSIAVKRDALVCGGATPESPLESKSVVSTEKEPPRMQTPMKEKYNLKSPFKLINKIKLRSEGRVLQSFVDENKLPHKFEDRELKNLDPKRKFSNKTKREKHSKLFVDENFKSKYSESLNLLEKLDLGSENSLKSEEMVVEASNKFGSEVGNPHLDKLNMKSKALKKSKMGKPKKREVVEAIQVENPESGNLDSLIVSEKSNMPDQDTKTNLVLRNRSEGYKILDQMHIKSKPLKKSKVGRPKKHKVVEVIQVENPESRNLDSLIVSEKSNMPEKDTKTNLVLRNRSEGYKILDQINIKSKPLKKSKTRRPKKRQGVEVQIKNSESENLDSLIVLEKSNLQEKEMKTDSVLKASGSIDSELETKNLDQMDKKSKVGRSKKHKGVEVIQIENPESGNLDSLIVSEKSNMPKKDTKTNLVLRNRSDGYKILDQINIKSKPLKKSKTGRPKKRQGVEVQIKNSESENLDSLIVLEKSNLQEKKMKTDSVLKASGSIDSELETKNLDQIDIKSKPLKKSKMERPKILDSRNSDPLIISEKSNNQEKEMKTDSSLKASGNIGFKPETAHMYQMDRKSKTLKKSETRRPKKHQVQAHQNKNSESPNLEPLNISENSKLQEKEIKKDLILKGSGNVGSELKTTHLNQMDMKIKGVKKSKTGRLKKRKEIIVPENENSKSGKLETVNISEKSEFEEKKINSVLKASKSISSELESPLMDKIVMKLKAVKKSKIGRQKKRKEVPQNETSESGRSDSLNISGKYEIREKKRKKDLALESFEKSSCKNLDGTRLYSHSHLEKRRRDRKAKCKVFESSEFPESEHSESVVHPYKSKRDVVTKELPSENPIVKAFIEYNCKFKQAPDNAMSESEMKNISSTSFTEANQSGNLVPPPIQNLSSDLDNDILNNISPTENTSTGTDHSKQSVPKALVNRIAEPETLSANETNYSPENPTSKAHTANHSPKKSNLSSEEHSEPEEYNDDTIIYSYKSESSSPEIQAPQTSTTDFIKTRSSRQKDLLQQGSVEHSKVQLRICNRCNKCFLHEDDMISHYATTHAKRSKKRDSDRITPIYSKCSVSFVMKVPEENNRIHCSVCDRSLPYTDFKVHTYSCIGQLFFRCTLCICVFYDKKELGNHMYWDHEKNDVRLLFVTEQQ